MVAFLHACASRGHSSITNSEVALLNPQLGRVPTLLPLCPLVLGTSVGSTVKAPERRVVSQREAPLSSNKLPGVGLSRRFLETERALSFTLQNVSGLIQGTPLSISKSSRAPGDDFQKWKSEVHC